MMNLTGREEIKRAAGVAQWIECLPSIHGALGSLPRFHRRRKGGTHLTPNTRQVCAEEPRV